MAVEVLLNFALEVVALHIFVVLNKDQFFTHKSPVRQEVVVLLKALDGHYLLLNEVVVLKLFDLILLILHPKDSRAIEVKRYCNLRHLELPMQFDLVLISINLVQVLVFQLQLHS